jgi:hypothetical protein
VSDLAFTAEVRVRVENQVFNDLGYVRTAPGKQIGIPGKMGICVADGIYAGSRRLVNTIGPCNKDSWRTMVVASGNKKRLAVETFPSDADIFIDGKRVGKTKAFQGSISEKYGYLFVTDPPKAPINVTIKKKGYATVDFGLDWNDCTYRATVPLRAEQ